MEYDKDYFIKKFEDIPENEIGEGCLDDHCALYHCGVENDGSGYTITPESASLILLFGGENERDYKAVTDVNDIKYELGSTPKERILNKLRSL